MRLSSCSIWAFMLFDVRSSTIPDWVIKFKGPAPQVLTWKLPAGLYVRSIIHGSTHAKAGHWGMLLGKRRSTGWWYYFPVVAAYKVPIGIGVTMLLGLISFRALKFAWREWGLLIPAVAWTILMMTSHLNIGFRHFLPAYVFMLMLATRCVAPGISRWMTITALAAIAITTVDVARWHPDELSYINHPGGRPYLSISDSNVDWGQGLQQVCDWLRAHPTYASRPIALRDFGGPKQVRKLKAQYWLGRNVRMLESEVPDSGILIISKVWVGGPYDKTDLYKPLRNLRAVADIGHAVLVYDVDMLKRRGEWPFSQKARKPATSPSTKAVQK